MARASVLLVVVLAAMPASAGAASWSIQPTPNVVSGRGTFNELRGVSCTSASACTAVGLDGSSSTTATLAERWDGTSWTVQPTPNPVSGASPQATLEGVSCTSAGACTAVGFYYSLAGPLATLVERWDGTSWTIQPSPNQVGKSSYLVGVSCTSSSACVAVGGSYDPFGTRPLVERWNGSTWAIVSVPTSPDAEDGVLTGVSCTSARACTTVGQYFIDEAVGTSPDNGATAEIMLPLVERLSGNTWTMQRTLSPIIPASASAGEFLSCEPFVPISACVDVSSSTEFAGASCASASACSAVGGYAGEPTEHVDVSPTADLMSRELTLAERWNGTLWLTQSTPNQPNSEENFLDGVSCASVSACAAVGSSGFRFFAPDPLEPLAERWTGKQWSIEPTPAPAGTASELIGVSCPSTATCTAVGDSSDGTTDTSSTLAERYS